MLGTFFYVFGGGALVSALDDLVKSLQAAVGSVEGAQNDVAQAESSAGEAVQAAAAFGREDDVMQVDALRSDIDQQSGALTAAKQELDELLQRAAALQRGN